MAKALTFTIIIIRLGSTMECAYGTRDIINFTKTQNERKSDVKRKTSESCKEVCASTNKSGPLGKAILRSISPTGKHWSKAWEGGDHLVIVLPLVCPASPANGAQRKSSQHTPSWVSTPLRQRGQFLRALGPATPA